jgi:anti-sigma factor (TIGR02949 family)
VSKLSCQEVLDQLWEYLDPSAQNALRQKIDEHLGSCRDCTVEVDSLLKTVSLYTQDNAGAVKMPIQLCERLQAALQEAYKARPAAGD